MKKTLLTLCISVNFLYCSFFAPAVFAAEVASKEQLQMFFQLANVAKLSDQVVNGLSAAQAKDWEDETDPEKKARKKAMFEKTDKVIRKYVNWPALEGFAIASYQLHFQENEIDELIKLYRSPIGQLRVNKFAPVIVEAVPKILQHLEKRIEELSEQAVKKQSTQPVTATIATTAATATTAQTEKTAQAKIADLALALIMSTPGVQTEFQAQMSGIEKAMLDSVRLITNDKKAKTEITRLAKRIQKEINFTELATIMAAGIAENLSEAEIVALTEDNQLPVRVVQMTKIRQADIELQKRLDTYLKQSILPELIPQLTNVMKGKEN
jgi:hypothetical protein